MSDIIKSCDIKVGYRSDHSRVDLEILISNFTRGRGLWKFNNSLLKNKNYVMLINQVIEEETIKYAVPVYDYSFLKNCCNYDDIVFKEESDTFLEMLLIRGPEESIKFATALKKETDAKEKQLIEDIEHSERSNLDTKNFFFFFYLLFFFIYTDRKTCDEQNLNKHNKFLWANSD